MEIKHSTKIKQKLINFFNLIRKDKKIKVLTIMLIITLFIFTLGYSLSMFNKNKINVVANIKVNDLSFNITTNSGTSDDRVLHLQANKIESFNVIITNLNKINTRYELIYDVCSDSNCTNILNSLPDGVKVEFMEENSAELNGLINNNNSSKEIKLLTTNNTNNDVYIKLNLNAGYEWNELELANQINEYSKTTDIIAYVDGVEVTSYPKTCDYVAYTKAFLNNKSITLFDLDLKCDLNMKRWKLEFTGFADKIEIYFVKTTFGTDSWETIASFIGSGNMSYYPIGSEKVVKIDDKKYTVRVANNTTPEECNNEDFSQTACGFVVEFVDIIEQRKMNSSKTNVGSWEASELRTYANGEFFNKLPSDLQKVIINTKVITGHGNTTSENNFLSTDKIYLLSLHEVAESGDYTYTVKADTAYSQTRQLDYYKLRNSLSKSLSGTSKKDNYKPDAWWLRTPLSESNDSFLFVQDDDWFEFMSYIYVGFAPAFRIDTPEATTFADDSWSTISKTVKAGKANEYYKIGDEKEINIGGTNYTVRIANNTSPDECNNEDFSQTACGFVVEFVDIPETRAMNSKATNVGGWPASSLRTYANNDFLKKLPSDLQNVIIDTKVVSGHGSTSGEENFVSTDKIYLLSSKEIWNAAATIDTASDLSRQLDYYKLKGVTGTSFSGAIKVRNGSNTYWWLRTAMVSDNSSFRYVYGSGSDNYVSSTKVYSFAPAFRIG